MLSANDRLNEQNEMLKKNRGVKIDHDQFKSWKNQIDDLRFSLEEAEEKEKLLTEENSMQATMIVDLEEELRRLRMRGKQQEEEVRGRSKSSLSEEKRARNEDQRIVATASHTHMPAFSRRLRS